MAGYDYTHYQTLVKPNGVLKRTQFLVLWSRVIDFSQPVCNSEKRCDINSRISQPALHDSFLSRRKPDPRLR